MWTDYFDKIYLINLPQRTDRLSYSMQELRKYDIHYSIFPAVYATNGRKGLLQTMFRIFEEAIKAKYKRILVFEDDIRFIADPNEVMPKCIEQMPGWYDLFYLGCNHPKPFKEFYSKNILKVERALSSHAVAYTQLAMQQIILWEHILSSEDFDKPYDILIAEIIHPWETSYCAFPMIATQIPGHSDIEGRWTNWKFALEDRFAENVKHLL